MKKKYINVLFRCSFFLFVFVMIFGSSNAQKKHKIESKANKDSSLSILKYSSHYFTIPDSAIVHIPFGEKHAWELTDAVSVLSGSELEKTFSSTLSNALYGRIPGLTVMQGNGEPGYDSPSMFIRGTSSYNGSSILTYVDGFESPIDQLTPDEIENITVLKDAASAAMYGIRGANRAILVTTKRGKVGPTKISFSMKSGLQTPMGIPKFLGSYDYARLYNEALTNDGEQPFYSQSDLDAYKQGNDPAFHPDVDWYKEVLKKSSPLYNFNLNFSGGSKTVNYFVLLNLMNNGGLYKGTDPQKEKNSNADFSRYNFRSNVDLKLTKNLSASLDLSGRIEDRSYPGRSSSEIWGNMELYPPNAFPVYNPDGSYGGNSIYQGNPEALVLGTGYATTHDRNLQATFRLTQKLDFITKGLSADGDISFSNYFTSNSNKTKQFEVYSISQGFAGDTIYTKFGQKTSLANDEGGSNQWRRTNLQVRLNYDRKFNKSKVQGGIVYHQEAYVVSGNNVPYAYQGFSGRFNYNYNNKYLSEISFGYNGSENFPKGKRFGFFPAVSVGWILSNENFLKDKKWINSLKLRASYGLVGNDNISGQRFMYDQYYSYSGGYYFGKDNTYTGGIVEGSLANPMVTWEKDKELNIGTDATVFKHLNLSLDVFNEKHTNILAQRNASVPSIIGVGLPAENVGEVSNKGFEFSLDYNNLIADKLKYNIGTQISYAHNKILYMDEAVQPYPYLYRTGHSIGEPFGLVALGFFKDQADIDNSPVQTFAPVQPGDVKYKDQNNDGHIDVYDEVPLGKPNLPEITYAFHLGLSYKSVDVNAFFQGVAQRSVYLQGPLVWAFVNNAKIAPIALNRWTPESAATAFYPRLTTSPNDNNYRMSSLWMRNGSFLRLRNVEVGYTFPASFVKKLHMNYAKLFLIGTNLFIFDHIKITDPETMGGYPAMKSYNVGLQLKF